MLLSSDKLHILTECMQFYDYKVSNVEIRLAERDYKYAGLRAVRSSSTLSLCTTLTLPKPTCPFALRLTRFWLSRGVTRQTNIVGLSLPWCICHEAKTFFGSKQFSYKITCASLVTIWQRNLRKNCLKFYSYFFLNRKIKSNNNR